MSREIIDSIASGENLEAEAIGLIYSEACENVRGIELYQHDTTKRSVDESSEILRKFFEGNVKLDETIDYSERIMDWY